jgi:hypothetical protein
MKHIVAALMGLALLAGGASAQGLERVYWGVSNGNPEPDENTIKYERSRYAENNLDWNNARTWRGDTSDGLKLYRGVVNDGYTATEVGIAFLGDMYFVTEGDRVNGNQRRMFDERSSRALYYDKLKYWGDSESIRWFGRLGIAVVNTEAESRIWLGGNSYTSNTSDTGIVLKAGVGLQLRMSDTWHVRTELENYFDVGNSGGNMPKTDITVFSFGLLRLF